MLLLTLVVLAQLALSNCANILILQPFLIRSQLAYWRPLAHALASRNHSVTVVSGDKDDGFDEKLVEVLITRDITYPALKWDKSLNFVQSTIKVHHTTAKFSRRFFSSHVVKDLLASNRTFDAVITSTHFVLALAAIPHRFKALHIEFRSQSDHFYSSLYNGNPIQTDSGCSPEKSAFQNFIRRALNTWGIAALLLYREIFSIPEHQKIIDELCRYEGYESRPPLRQLLYKKSLFLTNSHLTLSSRKHPSLFQKEVAGISIPWGAPRPSLPSDFEKFIGNSTSGFILLSWGSMISSSDGEVGETILEALGRLPFQVIWKVGKSRFSKSVPDNVMLSPWVPQLALLGDERIKLFWTHGGISSMIEAIYYQLPVVVTPINYDQPKHAAFMAEKSMGLVLSIDNITEETILWTINEVVNNPKYKEGAREMSRAFKSRPLPPLDEAIYWIERTITFKDFIPRQYNRVISLFLLENSDIFLVTFASLILMFIMVRLLFLSWFITYSKTKQLNSTPVKLKHH